MSGSDKSNGDTERIIAVLLCLGICVVLIPFILISIPAAIFSLIISQIILSNYWAAEGYTFTPSVLVKLTLGMGLLFTIFFSLPMNFAIETFRGLAFLVSEGAIKWFVAKGLNSFNLAAVSGLRIHMVSGISVRVYFWSIYYVAVI